jgi:uncharacterized protein
MPVALGGAPEVVPSWALQSIANIFLNIIEGLISDPPEVGPIFWQPLEDTVIAMDWCEGFMHAVSLRPKAWLRLTESGIGGQLITPMMLHLLDENGSSVMGIPQEGLEQTLAKAAEQIPDCIVAIHKFW